MLSRRALLQQLIVAGGYCLLPLGRSSWALAAPQSDNRHLIVIMMRGAVDGLSIVPPYREQNYYASRTNIALQPPGSNEGAFDLDGFFGLNPSLVALMPLWQNKTLAFVQASGSPSETRSHFEAQDIMETALLNSAMATQGWMNGLAQALPDNQAPTRVLSFGNTLPKIFQGHANVSTVPTGIRSNGGRAVEDTALERQLSQMYGPQTQLGGLYKQALSARAAEMQDLQDEMTNANKGAPGADAFVIQSTKIADMIRRDPKIQLVFMDVGGWDTHINQGNAKGQLASKLGKLGDGLAALTERLGAEYKNTAILVMSEFGRTVAQNGNGGTDHGHGNVAWVMGGSVQGGKVYGRWPGLSPNQLWQGRDLSVTTDFRSVIGAVIAGQFGLSDTTIRQIVPSYIADSGLRSIIS